MRTQLIATFKNSWYPLKSLEIKEIPVIAEKHPMSLGEFDLIAQLKKKFATRSSGVRVGVGDDAAVIVPSPGMELLFTTDALVEGAHFKSGLISPFQLGRKAAAVNVSDIAAMGGVPKYLLATVAVPASQADSWIQEFSNGMESLAGEFGVTVVGGDLSHSPCGISISITLAGEVEVGCALLRSGAKIKDVVMVTGNVGDSAAGLELLLGLGTRNKDAEELVQRHLEPRPRVDCGRFLAQNKLATACIDLSDGLSSDLRRICEASDVGALVDEAKLPLSEALRCCAPSLKNKITHYALNGGEDYELLFTVSPEKIEELMERWPAGLPPITEIGKIVSKEERMSLRRENGSVEPLAAGGHDHFSK